MSIRTAPCEWPIADGCCTYPTNASPEQIALQEISATEWLWNLTGRRYGLCEHITRPCRKDCYSWMSNSSWGLQIGASGGGTNWIPVLTRAGWTNMACGCWNACSCSRVCELELPSAPVNEIVEVLVDGLVVSPDAYRVDDFRWLVRTDGGCWPECQNLTAAASEEGTWQVTYKWGIPVPVGGQTAAAILACELVKACVGDVRCRLPSRVQSMSRQGVTIQFAQDIHDALTGLPDVDGWVRSVNPSLMREPSRVYSVDMLMPRSTTWVPGS